MSFIVTVNKLTKVYRDKESGLETKALDDVTLNIQEKDFVAVAGPSGSGKTTLLNIIGGLDRASQGEVIVDTTNFSLLNESALADFRLREIGFVFQAYNLIPTLTALENAEYVSLLQGIHRKHRQHDVMAVFKDLGMEALARRKPNQLSAGQQQRVAVARAIVAQPKLILADEPTANLDSKTGEELIDLMYRMNQNLGITFIFATHDKMVMDKAKVLITMRDGKIVS